MITGKNGGKKVRYIKGEKEWEEEGMERTKM